MDPLKEAFSKIKEDISFLKNEISEIKNQITELKIQTQTPIQTNRQTDKQTQESPIMPSFTHKNQSSIGNGGVPTDKQTNRQTDKQTQNPLESSYNPQYPQKSPKDPLLEFRRANEILDSLDDIKTEIRAKFKNLTPQEMLVFSTLYGLEEEKIEKITYRTLASQLHLSESSIRDYINKLTKKGVPIERIRQNNKTVLLKISQELKNVATLDTILHLRGL